MTKLFAVLSIALMTAITGFAQKRVLNYPFEFEKSFLARGDYDAYFLDNRQDSGFAIILKDNKKADYALLDKNFKVVSKFTADIGKTVFDDNADKYVGGTTDGKVYHFAYLIKSTFLVENVDFGANTITHEKLLEPAKGEKQLASFSDNNVYYSIMTDDKNSSIVVYVMNGRGQLQKKVIPFKIPADASKHRNELSEYLRNLKVIKTGEEPDLSAAVVPAKLFTQPNRFDLVMNDGDNPTHIVTLNLQDFSIQEKFIAYSDLISKEDKGKVHISSFLKDNILFSLILNKKSIRIAMHNVTTGALLNKYEITADAGSELFSQPPVAERRMGKKVDTKDVDDVKRLIKIFTTGTEGLMIAQNKTGQYILTAGTYDAIQLSSGSSAPTYMSALQPAGMMGQSTSTGWAQNTHMYMIPGTPSYTTTSARYYNTTYFKLLLDANTLKTTRARLPTPVPEQIKDYMDTVDKKAKATNQFSIGKNQYFGYYDRDAKSYVIEQIRLVN